MVVIFQPDRILLYQQINKFSSHIGGLTLDVGAGGYDRYSGLFSSERYIRLDFNIQNKPDLVADAHALPFKHEVFDSIVCTQVLEHLKNPFLAVSEFRRILKPQGIVLLTVPQVNELHEEPHDYYRYTRFGIIHLLETNHFEILSVDQRGGFFSTLAQQIIRYVIDRWDLYSSVKGRLLKPFISAFGRFMINFDKLDKSLANRKHAIGWCVVARNTDADFDTF